MENFTHDIGFTSTSSSTEANIIQQSSRLWRPWTGKEDKTAGHKAHFVPQDASESKYFKPLPVIHPVKLYWPKSKCFDYLYQDAEMLLRSYPVQATICPYEDSSSDEESDDEEDEMEKEQN